MLLLISDANIIIDLEAGEILGTLFRLPYEFAMPDVLYEEEIRDGSPQLLEMGLATLTVDGEFVAYAEGLGDQYGLEPGFNDRLALALAKQESCPLLTGDASLRALAASEEAEVRGTLWILVEMVEFGLLRNDDALAALDLMKTRRRRLPWKEAQKWIEDASFCVRQASV